MTLILVSLLILYVYWNQTEQELHSTALPVNKTELVKENKIQSENEKTFVKHVIIENESQKAPIYPGDLFPEDKNQGDKSSGDINNVILEHDEIIKADQKQKSIKTAGFQDKELQEQIRARQKKLSNQMVSLISVTMDDSESTPAVTNNVDTAPVESVIETPAQRQLLLEARQAFEQRNFMLAEEKYLQLMNTLPKFPDIIGELANVYKIQKRQSDYIAMNTRFVKQLSEHHRFNEAWRVVSETDKIDKKTANKQRRIINKKQKDLEFNNKQ